MQDKSVLRNSLKALLLESSNEHARVQESVYGIIFLGKRKPIHDYTSDSQCQIPSPIAITASHLRPVNTSSSSGNNNLRIMIRVQLFWKALGAFIRHLSGFLGLI